MDSTWLLSQQSQAVRAMVYAAGRLAAARTRDDVTLYRGMVRRASAWWLQCDMLLATAHAVASTGEVVSC